MSIKRLLLIAGLVAIALLLVSCGEDCEECPEPVKCPDPVECPDCPPAPECPECPTCPEPPPCPDCPACPDPEPCPELDMSGVPYQEMWAASPHNDTEAEAFRHWDEDDPAQVPEGCAACHSSTGYQDFLGADGTEAGVVDAAAALGTTVDCVACHNEATAMLTSVTFPSGVTLTGLGDSARCMVCHQGRASGLTVDGKIEGAGLTEDLDTVSEDLSFTNIHYFAAAATLYGSEVMGGYQYEGKMYDVKFEHVPGIDACDDCHNPHTLEVEVENCTGCHDVASAEDFMDSRMAGTMRDYDGDGDAEEGVYYEIQGLQEILYGAMQAYSADVAGVGLVYDAGAYPYFFDDAGERYASWTGRLTRAAYNYQTSLKDPGAHAHGGKYMIQLLYDSIEDLDAAAVEGLTRNDAGHFAGSTEAWRHWDEDGDVQASCAKCHSATGLPTYVAEGVNVSEPLANGMLCSTCHTDYETYARYEIESVTFPSGAEVVLDPDNNLCLNCHQGRESSMSISSMNEGLDPDTVDAGVRFRNIHYFPAGATLFGGETMGAAQFEGQEYVGKFAHVPGADTCVACHGGHGLTVQASNCEGCHGTAEVHDIRMSADDYDGDGDVEEGMAGEIDTMREALYAAMQAYSTDVVGTGIVYDSHAYPYFFDEAGERYSTFSPRLAHAAFNYQYSMKDPGAFAHNGKYVIQILYDTLNDLGADVSGMTRP